MFQGALLRLLLSRVLWASCSIVCFALSAQTARAYGYSRSAEPVEVAQSTIAAAVRPDAPVRALVAPRGADALIERNLDELERRSPALAQAVLPPPARAELGVAFHHKEFASCFCQSGPRPGRGAKGARDPGEVQRELPAG